MIAPTHEANSASVPVAPPVSAEVDGWTIESYSAVVPQTQAEVTAAITPAPATPEPEKVEVADDVPATMSALAEVPEAEQADGEETPEADAKAKDEKPVEAPKKKRTAEDRIAELRAEINALTRTKHAVLRDIEAAKRTTSTAPALSVPSPSLSTTPAVAASAETHTPVPAPDPLPTWKAYEEAGKSWDEYAEAYAAWTDRKLERAREDAKAEARQLLEQERAQQEQRSREAHLRAEDEAYQRRVQAIEAKRPDFAVRVQTNLSDIPQSDYLAGLVKYHRHGVEVLDYLADHPDECRTLSSLTSQMLPAMIEAAAKMDNPTPLLSYYAQHPDEYDALARMSPSRQLLTLGSLFPRFDGANSTASPSPAPVSHAAPPIRPIGGTRQSAEGRKSLEDLDLEDYIRVANKRERERGRLG